MPPAGRCDRITVKAGISGQSEPRRRLERDFRRSFAWLASEAGLDDHLRLRQGTSRESGIADVWAKAESMKEDLLEHSGPGNDDLRQALPGRPGAMNRNAALQVRTNRSSSASAIRTGTSR